MISSFTSPQNIILVSPGKFAHSSSFEFEELAQSNTTEKLAPSEEGKSVDDGEPKKIKLI